jgi:hypothetical protein
MGLEVHAGLQASQHNMAQAGASAQDGRPVVQSCRASASVLLLGARIDDQGNGTHESCLGELLWQAKIRIAHKSKLFAPYFDFIHAAHKGGRETGWMGASGYSGKLLCAVIKVMSSIAGWRFRCAAQCQACCWFAACCVPCAFLPGNC